MLFLKWVASRLVPYTIVLFVMICAFMWITCSGAAIVELWPIIALLCLPAGVMVAANDYPQRS